MGERRPYKPDVVGSSPAPPTSKNKDLARMLKSFVFIKANTHHHTHHGNHKKREKPMAFPFRFFGSGSLDRVDVLLCFWGKTWSLRKIEVVCCTSAIVEDSIGNRSLLLAEVAFRRKQNPATNFDFRQEPGMFFSVWLLIKK